jgi:hypothetical protein
MTPEGKIKAKFNKGLKALQERYGNLMIRMPVTRGMGKPLLDYLLCVNGKFVMVEAKRDENHILTPQQRATCKECIGAGGTVYIIFDNVSIGEVLTKIEGYLWRA